MTFQALRRVLCFCLALLLLMPAMGLLLLADHDCCGDGCAVCAVLHRSTLSLAVLLTAVFAVLSAAVSGRLPSPPELAEESPVFRKDRLNN